MRYTLTPQQPLTVRPDGEAAPGPADVPVTLAEAKAWLNVGHSADDDLVSDVLVAVAETIETVTGLSFAPRTFVYSAATDRPHAAQGLGLPRRPVATVDALVVTDRLGTVFPLVEGGDYSFSPDGQIGFSGALALGPGSTLAATFTTAQADVPPPVLVALRRGVAFHYEHRSDVVTGTTAVGLPQGAYDLLLPHREVSV